MKYLLLLLLFPTLSFAYGDEHEPEINCLAENIYHESRGEGIKGMEAVGHVTMNRVESSRFPDSVCGVVKQAKLHPSWKTGELVPIRNACQFSWYCDGKPEVIDYDSVEWKNAKLVSAVTFYRLSGQDFTQGSMWYHADHVTPYWAHTMIKVNKVNNHIFYRQ